MLIRAQNKFSICNLDNVDCISNSYSGNPKDTRFEISAFNQKEKTILGYYQTEERAIEVLDEICNAYISLNKCMGKEFRSNNPSGYFGGYVKNGFFQMPEV